MKKLLDRFLIYILNRLNKNKLLPMVIKSYGTPVGTVVTVGGLKVGRIQSIVMKGEGNGNDPVDVTLKILAEDIEVVGEMENKELVRFVNSIPNSFARNRNMLIDNLSAKSRIDNKQLKSFKWQLSTIDRSATVRLEKKA